MPTPEPIVPDVVIDAICYNFAKRCGECGESFTNAQTQANHMFGWPAETFTEPYRILREMRWSGDCWMVEYAGMTMGIETDGYIHS